MCELKLHSHKAMLSTHPIIILSITALVLLLVNEFCCFIVGILAYFFQCCVCKEPEEKPKHHLLDRPFATTAFTGSCTTHPKMLLQLS